MNSIEATTIVLEPLATFDLAESWSRFIAEIGLPVAAPQAVPAQAIEFPGRGWERAPAALAALSPDIRAEILLASIYPGAVVRVVVMPHAGRGPTPRIESPQRPGRPARSLLPAEENRGEMPGDSGGMRGDCHLKNAP
jgi:hypothetical protein